MGKSIKKKLKKARRDSRNRAYAIKMLIRNGESLVDDLLEEREWSAYLFTANCGLLGVPLVYETERREWEEERRAVTPKG